MEANALIILGSVVLSLLFEYVPGLEKLYGSKEPQWKALSMLLILFILTAGVYLLSCYGPLDYYVCGWNGIWEALTVLAIAIGANQGTHMMLKKRKAVDAPEA